MLGNGYKSPYVEPWFLLQFRNLFTQTVGLPCTVDQPVARPLPTHRTTQTENKRTQTSMPRVGFEPAIPEFERAKTIYALDGPATVIGPIKIYARILWKDNGNYCNVYDIRGQHGKIPSNHYTVWFQHPARLSTDRS
jgi:hypothetical protein